MFSCQATGVYAVAEGSIGIPFLLQLRLYAFSDASVPTLVFLIALDTLAIRPNVGVFFVLEA